MLLNPAGEIPVLVVDGGPAIPSATIIAEYVEETRAAGGQRACRFGIRKTIRGRHRLQVLVRDNNVDQALKALKKKMQREGIFREMKLRNYFEKPSERKAREKAEAVRRARKLARKRAQREGLLPGKPATPRPGAPARPGAPRGPR